MKRLRPGGLVVLALAAACEGGDAVETCATDQDCVTWLGPGWTCAPSSVSPHGLVCHLHADAATDATDASADRPGTTD